MTGIDKAFEEVMGEYTHELQMITSCLILEKEVKGIVELLVDKGIFSEEEVVKLVQSAELQATKFIESVINREKAELKERLANE